MAIQKVITPTDIGRGLTISANKVITAVPDLPLTIPGASAPSHATVQAFLAAQSPTPLPGTLLIWGGTATKPDLVYIVDKSNAAVKLYGALRDVTGQTALVINPTNAQVTWANGATENTPIATLTVTNPSAENALPLDIYVYHGVQTNLGTTASPKTQTVSVYSLVNIDIGGGTLQATGAIANLMGSGQISSRTTQADVGAFTDAGSQNASTLLIRSTVAAGATVTLRVQSQLNVRDGNTQAICWSYCQLAVRGKVQL